MLFDTKLKLHVDGSPTLLFGYQFGAGLFSAAILISLATNK